jgi:hypothetical protein
VWRTHPVISIHYFSLFALLATYPLILVNTMWRGVFFDATAFHMAVMSVFGVAYWMHARSLPADERVSPWAFLAMAIVMPVTYVLLTPLALFTLDSANWETRGHEEEPEPTATAPALSRMATEETHTHVG